MLTEALLDSGQAHDAVPGRTTVLGRLVAFAIRVHERRRRRARERHTVRVLRQLSDATLRDIGIERSEILSVAAGHHDRCRPRNGSFSRGSGDAHGHAAYSRENPELEQNRQYYRASLAGLALVLALVLALLASGAALAAGGAGLRLLVETGELANAGATTG